MLRHRFTTTTAATATAAAPHHEHEDMTTNDDDGQAVFDCYCATPLTAPQPHQPRTVGFAPSRIIGKEEAKAKAETTATTVTAVPSSLLLAAEQEDSNHQHQLEDLQSVGSASCTSSVATLSLYPNTKNPVPWRTKYVPPPVIPQSVVLAMGLLCFLLAYVWPPLILLLAYILSKLIPYSYRLNDDASYRRQQYKQFAQQDDIHPDRFYSPPDTIRIDESFWVNDRGMALSTMIMRPVTVDVRDADVNSSSSTASTVRAVVCLCHGYSDNLSYSKKVEYQRMAESGIVVVGIEYEGHGRSDGPLCLIEDWDRMVNDVASYFQQTVQQQFTNVPVFLMGESMGGAVAYSVYNRTPDLYKGVVFVCPMCKISDDMLPPQFVIDALKYMVGPTGSPSSWIGQLPLAPSKSDLYETAHHVPYKAEQMYRCPTSYGRNPRLVTARELLHATSKISASLSEFDAPFLIVHGREDRVTDPQLSLSLYRESKSDDKSIRLYDGMWHGITSTEPDDSIDRVFRDCIEWIQERC